MLYSSSMKLLRKVGRKVKRYPRKKKESTKVMFANWTKVSAADLNFRHSSEKASKVCSTQPPFPITH